MKRMLLLLAFLTAMSCCKKEKEPEFDPSSLSGTYWVMELDGTYYLLSFLGSSALYESYDGYGASSSVKSIRFYEYAYQNMAGMLASSRRYGKKQ